MSGELLAALLLLGGAALVAGAGIWLGILAAPMVGRLAERFTRDDDDEDEAG